MFFLALFQAYMWTASAVSVGRDGLDVVESYVAFLAHLRRELVVTENGNDADNLDHLRIASRLE